MYNDKSAVKMAKDIYEKYRNTEEDELYNDDMDEDYEEMLFAPPVEVDLEGYVNRVFDAVSNEETSFIVYLSDFIPSTPIFHIVIQIVCLKTRKRMSNSKKKHNRKLVKQSESRCLLILKR